MVRKFLSATTVVLALGTSLAAQAQGVPDGAAQGAQEGARAAGPAGAVVGGVVGGVAGGVAGVLGVNQRPRFHEYVVHEHTPSYRYSSDVRIGVVLPPAGIEYYRVPAEYGVPGYRYTVINDRIVLVDPRTHRIVDIIED